MNRYICIHGHFYQPPRENPWLDAIPLQDSAHPFHDWNERINSECYAPNTQARILDEKGAVIDRVNNYSRISFDFGPTLLSWMESKSPDTYQMVLEADKISQQNFSGHGSAMAQCYSHMIMPLASTRDKYTQVYWGIRDFEYRFKRFPSGMWLPETAVDLETLQIMADLGIRFTILAPHQAGKIITFKDKSEPLDIYRPYKVKLQQGKFIDVFFYNGPLSRSLAFENLLRDGQCFAEKLLLTDKREEPHLLSIATDGETYGHHHKFGDMALAFAIQYIEIQSDAQLTNYAEYLEKFPAEQEIEIKERTSWSCSHGVARWAFHCGCQTGGHPEWNQHWRAPLRHALDWLRFRSDAIFTDKGKDLFKDSWEAKNQYINTFLSWFDRGSFLDEQCGRSLNHTEKDTAIKLLEMQRHSMLMYTSCGWFFNDISGIETEQILLYAGRVIQFAEELSGDSLEPDFVKLLELAVSNLKGKANGGQIYSNIVKTATLDLPA